MKLYTDQYHTRVSTMKHEEDDREINISSEDWDKIMEAHVTKISETILEIINKNEQ